MFEKTTVSEKTLKTALLSNAVFSTLSGLTFMIDSQFVADLVGLGAPLLYQIIGAGLLGFAGYVAWTATRKPINTYAALQISLGDLLWVLGTILVIVLAFNSLNSAGIVAMLIVAGFVLTFALLQLKGMGQVYAVPGKSNTHQVCVAVDTPEPVDKMWSIVADLERIQDYSPHLAKVILRNGAEPGIDAVRQCTDNKGKTWAEHCTRYDHEARALDVIFLADEPGFPYPFKTMTGGWEVVPNGGRSTVNIWFEVTPKYGLAHSIILALMAKDLVKNFGDVVARMAAAARGEVVPHEALPPQQGISYKLATCH